MTNNNFSFYLVHRGYDPIMPSEEGYRIKNPVYSKFNIKMQRYDDQMFCRFTPDIDLSLHNEDFDYLRNLYYMEDGYLGLAIKIECYLGSSETKRLFGYISRKKCEWDFDLKKVTLKIDWVDEYTNLLANWDKEYDVIKLGVQSESVNINIQPIIQIYQQGSSLIDNFIGGEHFESNANSDLTENELINDYKFYKALEEYTLGPVDEGSSEMIKQIVASQGYEISSQFDPSVPFIMGGDRFGPLGPNVTAWSSYNQEGCRFRIETVLGEGASEAQVRELGLNLCWLSNHNKFEYDTDPDTGDPDLSRILDENGLLMYPIVYAYLQLSSSAGTVIAYDFNFYNYDGNKYLTGPQLYLYDSFSQNTKFYFGNPSSRGYDNVAEFKVTNRAPFFARLICAEGGFDGYTSALLKSDELNPNPKVYKKGVPLDPNLLPAFRGVTLSISRNYSLEFNGFGCYTVNGENRFYLPPTNIDETNPNNAWYPALRTQWDSASYWIRFGDAQVRQQTPGADFWGQLPFYQICLLKDAYRVDNIIRVLVCKINESRNREDKEIKVAEITEDAKNEHTSLGSVTFSRFFENINVSSGDIDYSKALYNQTYGYIPYFAPASNLMSVNYAVPAQTWKISLKKLLTWMADCFNCYFFIREVNGSLYFEIENETYFKQGFQYENDPSFYGDESSLFNRPYIDLARTTIDSRSKKYYEFGQNKFSCDQSLLPKRYEFNCAGEGGCLFNSFNIDMDVTLIKKTDEKVPDFSINQISSIKKITPEVYADVDRMFGTPDSFDKSGTVLLMVQRSGLTLATHTRSVLRRDGRNGLKWIRTANFYASWAALSVLRTHYVHTKDVMSHGTGQTDWIYGDMITPFSDMFNYQDVSYPDGTIKCLSDITNSTTQASIRYTTHGCNLWRGLLRGKTMRIEIETPVWINALKKKFNNSYTEVESNANDYLQNAVIYMNAPIGFCSVITESADLNLLTGNAKFKFLGPGF